MKNIMAGTKKELRHLQINGCTKEELIFAVSDELLKFYTHKLTDFESYSNLEKEKLVNLLQDLVCGKYNEKINSLISREIQNLGELFEGLFYNAKVVIEDNLVGYGNLKLNIKLAPSWLEGFAI
ncbi:hypothetical protein [Niallia taxi]|uniref:Uncharacterized protein n=1 Tax=Niallia taxi TaxID=2499688 RepID=A0A437KDX2_9BACI|nr:hypothetical protein [Niallia taxi]RVT65297.1 hypothetical protein EM808_07255 [Niallia taxi]